MGLAAPKLRTGPIEPGPAALKYRPRRDALGRVVSPARVWLTPISSPEILLETADAVIPVSQEWLARLKRKDRVRFTDARGASRTMTVSGAVGRSRWAEANRTAYIVPGLSFEIRRSARKEVAARAWRTRVGVIPSKEQTLRLKLGDTLVLTRSLEPGVPRSAITKMAAFYAALYLKKHKLAMAGTPVCCSAHSKSRDCRVSRGAGCEIPIHRLRLRHRFS